METQDFNVTPWVSQPTKLGLKVGQLMGILRPGTAAASWNVSVSWGFVSCYNSEGELAVSVDLKGANIDLVAKDSVTITARNGFFFTFYPQSEVERKEWVMAIGAMMQVHQSHWKSHEIVPIFEHLAARVLQLASISRTPTQVDVSDRLRATTLDLMVAYTWNSTKRTDKIVRCTANFIQIIKTLITNRCPEDITDSLSLIARQIVPLASLPIPTLSKSSSQTDIKPITFEPGTQSQSSSLKISSSHQSTTKQPTQTPSNAAGAQNSNGTHSTSVASPSAGRRLQQAKSSGESNLEAGSSASSSHVSGSSSLGSAGSGSTRPMRRLSEEKAVRVQALEAAETQQEQILRLVKDVRGQFVKSIEAFKANHMKQFEVTVTEAEKALNALRASFEILLKPVESHAVLHRLGETPERYYWTWKRAVEVVRRAFAEPDRAQAMAMLRENLPAVGDAMGQASHVLCGAVFEAAQQIFAEQELKNTISLFVDLETSRVAKFLHSHQAAMAHPHSNASQDVEFLEITRKILLSAQTTVKICQASFFDVVAADEHTKHASILERLVGVADKMIAEVEANETLNISANQRTAVLEAMYATRDFGQVASTIIESVAELDSNPRLSLSTISPQIAIQNLASRRGSTQSISSRLNVTQMRFATASKQLCYDLEPLLDLVPETTIDESKLSVEQLRVRRASIAPVAAFTRFILHNQIAAEDATPNSPTTQSATHTSNSTSLSTASSDPHSPPTHAKQLASPTSTGLTSTSPPQGSGSLTTWSEKVRPKNSLVEIPHLPTNLSASTSSIGASPNSGRFAAATGGKLDSPTALSSPSSGSSSGSAPSSSGGDSIQWRKSVKSRDDPVSPRADSNSPSVASSSSGFGSISSLTSGMGALSLGSIAGASVSSSTSYSSPSSPTSGSRRMQTLTVNGVDIEYPESMNIWLEPEEGNFKYLKGSELENEHSASSAASSGSTSPPSSASSRNLAHTKAQSAIALGRGAVSSHSLAVGGKTASPSESDSIASGSKLGTSSSHSGLPLNASRSRISVEPILASATLNRLIVKLTSESTVDVAFLKSFLATYRSFTTPEELWGKLLERYNVPPKPKECPLSDEAYKQSCTLPIHLRVANVIGMWLATNWTDITAQLMVHIEHFIVHIVPCGEAKGLQKKLRTALDKAQADKRALELQENARYGRVRAGGTERARAFRQVMLSARAARLDPFMFFLEEDIEPQIVAEQLTGLDWQLYSKITNVELLNKSWSRDDKNVSPNVRGMIQRFNEVSSWVATNILWQDTMEARVKVYTKVIQTAHALFKLNNFNATLAIISGLNNAAIHRLKFTFNELPKREKAALQLLMEKMSSKGSYKEYRELLKRVSPPKIPYLGVYLTDLTFIEDGNPNNIGHLINFHKRRLVHRVLQDIEQYQDTPFNFPIDTRLSFVLGKLSFIDDNELYNLSLLREPRGCDRADIH
jgi:hypothetical protein